MQGVNTAATNLTVSIPLNGVGGAGLAQMLEGMDTEAMGEAVAAVSNAVKSN